MNVIILITKQPLIVKQNVPLTVIKTDRKQH